LFVRDHIWKIIL